MKIMNQILSQGIICPPIDYELLRPRAAGLLKGRVLNAGAGNREISHLVDGELTNQDIWWEGDTRRNINVYSPIHRIPTEPNHFDSVVCIAVLEHVENPEDVIPEFFRVLKPGGVVIASVPFLQPEHKAPTDFQRYTQDGLSRLFRMHGFEIVQVETLFTVYHTLHWIVYEWLHLRNTFIYRLLRILLLPTLAVLARKSRLSSPRLASVFQIVARKPKT